MVAGGEGDEESEEEDPVKESDAGNEEQRVWQWFSNGYHASILSQDGKGYEWACEERAAAAPGTGTKKWHSNPALVRCCKRCVAVLQAVHEEGFDDMVPKC